jgi:hypothetical protein
MDLSHARPLGNFVRARQRERRTGEEGEGVRGRNKREDECASIYLFN